MERMELAVGILLLLNFFLQMIILYCGSRRTHLLKQQMKQMQEHLDVMQTKLAELMELENSSQQETLHKKEQSELRMQEAPDLSNPGETQVHLSQEEEALINEVLSEVFT